MCSHVLFCVLQMVGVSSQILEFILSYAGYLQVIHAAIFEWFKHGSYEIEDVTDFVRVIHIIYLTLQHFYLFNVLTMPKARPNWLRNIQWIAWVISNVDWFSMHWMALRSADRYGWFHSASFVYLLIDTATLIYFVMYLIKRNHHANTYVGFEYDALFAWEITYAVFAGVYLLAFYSGAISWILYVIVTLPPTGAQFMHIAAVFSAYTIVVFYIVFPNITDTFGRPFFLISYLGCGWVMGICDTLVLSSCKSFDTKYSCCIYHHYALLHGSNRILLRGCIQSETGTTASSSRMGSV
jgi:hypothetical protein